MLSDQDKRLRTLEILLIGIVIGLTVLFHQVDGYKMIVLNLFYLPVVLAAFFLGRYRAGVLALLCVILASVAAAMDLQNFAAFASPIVIGLAVTTWGAVLGLTTILVGSLSDERAAKMLDLHEAHVGVLEVLSRYLQSANPHMQDRSRRVAELSQKVAAQLRLSEKEIDDVRVAALLQDMENLEITAKVISKAVGDLDPDRRESNHHTFHGTELVHSLGSVMTGALPLLSPQLGALDWDLDQDGEGGNGESLFGSRILRTVRLYDSLVNAATVELAETPADAIQRLRQDIVGDHHPAVLHALEQVVLQSRPSSTKPVPVAVPLEPALA